jgi:hypothetical protein
MSASRHAPSTTVLDWSRLSTMFTGLGSQKRLFWGALKGQKPKIPFLSIEALNRPWLCNVLLPFRWNLEMYSIHQCPRFFLALKVSA